MGTFLIHFVIRNVGFLEKIFVGFHDTLPLLISGWGGASRFGASRFGALYRMIINYTNI